MKNLKDMILHNGTNSEKKRFLLCSTVFCGTIGAIVGLIVYLIFGIEAGSLWMLTVCFSGYGAVFIGFLGGAAYLQILERTEKRKELLILSLTDRAK